MNGTRISRKNVRRFGRLRDKRVGNAGGKLIETQYLIECRVGHDARHQRRVHRMTGALRDHVSQQRPADQRQIADQVQRLVPAALVRETAGRRGFARLARRSRWRCRAMAPRISPMSRIWSRSCSKPKVRAGAISCA